MSDYFHYVCLSDDRSVNEVVKDIAFGSESLGSIPWPVKSDCLANGLLPLRCFFCSCVAQTLSHGDGARHLLHSSTYYCKYNEDLIFVYQTLYKTQVRELKEDREDLEKKLEEEQVNISVLRDERYIASSIINLFHFVYCSFLK